jgi:hypothetical protein
METQWGAIWKILAIAAVYSAMYHILTTMMKWGSNKSSYNVQKTQFIAWLVFTLGVIALYMYFNRRVCDCTISKED